MAGVEGLEPSPTVLETGMLPLHQTPMEHWVGVEPTNSGFADHSSTDGDPAHFGAPGGDRTRDSRIKSPLPYHLVTGAYILITALLYLYE